MDGTSFVSGGFLSQLGLVKVAERIMDLGCAFGAELVILDVNVKEADTFSPP